ncbi:hypothetical protein A2870_02750 [Candidatus Curtissbacteria bacterium RIFCSPHIGHO2_01_FULL_41_11]|uniref:Methyltransferase domain-containing protein n=1 Tax=Candidatus Curtissbacteria bacterium RIFCSPHIGHO2_01_FULL_41_11 TaxID=1797711 RepID=A0A1F5G4J6_9BACT|nr:MAG: hypothetical protein A2870_02750 [Candidatus Curtissbacteria bacterium RIFCSPHIGHO2_01_FULL_41_11]
MQFLIIPFLLIVVFLLLFVILIFLVLSFDIFLELPYVATEHKKIETIIKLAAIKKGETAIDLGSGDGRLLLAAAQKGAIAVGYEVNPFLIAITLIHAKLKGLSENISVYKQNLWNADLKTADVIFVYGRQKNMERFENYVFRNSNKKTRVVVNTNPFPGKKPHKEENGIFLYLT